MKLAINIKKYIKPLLGLAGLAVVVVWSGGFLGDKTAPGTLDAETGFPLPEGAETLPVEIQTVPTRVDVVGTTASEEKINLSARIPAYVSDVFASAGDRVTKGQELVTLDDRDIRQQLAAAEAQLNQARTEYDRAKSLFEKEATTQQALTAAESMFHAAQAQVEQVKVMLTYAQVTSPIDGIVTERRIEAGDLANPGMLLLAVYDPSRMRLEAPVPVRLLDRLAVGQSVEVTLDRPAKVFPGTVSEIVSEVDPASRTQLVKIHLDVADGDVLPGTFGRLWVDAGPREVIAIPSSAIIRVGQLEFVQTVRDGRVVRRLVKTGPARDTSVEILSGLSAGDVILVNPVPQEG
ncbi:MAG: efflux RND transporter periplasmic adaptor subunit [Kiritimatiellae bacterium]|nr:efflux RND transporter periplasmic adaptor subunit [Kiritimatiellia bacterium]